MSEGRFRRFATAAVLVLVGALTLHRASRLTGSRLPLDAHGERAWFAWACPDPRVEPQLEAAAARLPAGRAIWVEDRHPRLDPGWLRIISLYAMPAQCVVGAGRPGEGPGGSRAARLAISVARGPIR